MSYERMPIVGAWYRPPAQALIAVLAIGTPLRLFAEPDNQADPNAVAVFLRSADIPVAAHETLAEALAPTGHTLEGILDQEEWHLGYIPKHFAKQLREADIVPLSVGVDVTFGTNPAGEPRVIFPEPVL